MYNFGNHLAHFREGREERSLLHGIETSNLAVSAENVAAPGTLVGEVETISTLVAQPEHVLFGVVVHCCVFSARSEGRSMYG